MITGNNSKRNNILPDSNYQTDAMPNIGMINDMPAAKKNVGNVKNILLPSGSAANQKSENFSRNFLRK
jgi:hypothetical protein